MDPRWRKYIALALSLVVTPAIGFLIAFGWIAVSWFAFYFSIEIATSLFPLSQVANVGITLLMIAHLALVIFEQVDFYGPISRILGYVAPVVVIVLPWFLDPTDVGRGANTLTLAMYQDLGFGYQVASQLAYWLNGWAFGGIVLLLINHFLGFKEKAVPTTA